MTITLVLSLWMLLPFGWTLAVGYLAFMNGGLEWEDVPLFTSIWVATAGSSIAGHYLP